MNVTNTLGDLVTHLQGHVDEVRMRRLRAYAQALIEPLEEHMQDTYPDGRPLINVPEAVFVLAAATLYVHGHYGGAAKVITRKARIKKSAQDERYYEIDRDKSGEPA